VPVPIFPAVPVGTKMSPLRRLESTPMRQPTSVDSKPLTANPNSLDATLTKNTGEGLASFCRETPILAKKFDWAIVISGI